MQQVTSIDPPVLGAMIGAAVALLAALTSLFVGLINWRHNRQAFSAAVETRIEDLYDRLMDYRLKHPEVLRLSRHWKPECISQIYSQSSEEERAWAIYLGYVELCISYCNAVLVGRKRARLSSDVYRMQHEPLMKLLLTEHYPAMRQLTRDGGFVSAGIRNFMQEMQSKGWDWQAAHERLDKV